MAALGAIAVCPRMDPSGPSLGTGAAQRAESTPTEPARSSTRALAWWQPAAQQVLSPIDRVIDGVVREGEGPEAPVVARCEVRLFHRATSIFLARQQTDATGYFAFLDVPYEQEGYYVVAFDPDGGAVYNAVIFDRLTGRTL